MKGTYMGNNKMFVQTIYNRYIFAHADDLSLTPLLVSQGGFEIPLTKYIIEHIKPGHIAVDVGANIGYFTVLLANLVGRDGKVVAYEASGKNHRLLTENIQINYLQEATLLRKKAVHSTEGEITFYACDKFSGNGSTVIHDAKYKELYEFDHIHEEKVQTEKLDILKDEFEQIDFIKIDVEGGEYHVFLGMEKLLQEKKVNTIIFEMNKLRLQEKTDDFYALLKTYEEQGNYNFHLLNSEGKTVSVSLEGIFEQDFIDNVVMKLKK